MAFALGALASLTGCTAKTDGPQFVERRDAGIRFEHVCGGAEKDYIIEVNGGGVALFDYDRDGDLDIFFVNGSRLDQSAETAPSDALYRNDGGWKFVDVTESAGLREDRWGCGVAVADNRQ